MQIDIYTRGLIRKSVVVTITIGNETRYYYGSCGLIDELKYMGADVIEILKLLMKIRKIESDLKFKKDDFFWCQKFKLKYKLVKGW